MLRQALIPAAGRGARLDLPGTPKPLVEVGGEPLIVRLLKQMADAGIRRAVVVTGYRGRRIVRALSGRSDLNLELEFVDNPMWRRGLAGSILAARNHFTGPFLLSMADHVFDRQLIRRMAGVVPQADETVLLVDPEPERVYDLASAVKVQHSGRWLTGLGRNLTRFNAVDAGLLSAAPALFPALEASLSASAENEADLTEGMQRLAEQGMAQVELIRDEGWDDVDTPPDMVHAEQRLRAERRRRVLTAARRAVGSSAPSPDDNTGNAAVYRFVTGKPVSTRVVVGRGLAARPERLGLVEEGSGSSPVFVFTDETVNRLYGKRFVNRLRRAGVDAHAIVMADGEESKTLSNYAYLAERVLGKGIDERSVLISLGGGAVCNVCGFVASTLYRGVDLVHVPTTLMAQCDAAISHKQGVNGPRGKNLIGSYYPPRLVVVDVDMLATLERRLVNDGMAEVVKHALGQDPDYVDMLLDYRGDVRDPGFLEAVVTRNIRLKCRLMREDPCELEQGMVLQYGHTVGHPLEVLSGYTLYHGESVALGMMVAAQVARLMSIADDDLVELHDRLMSRYGLPRAVPADIRPADVIEALKYNKRYLVEGTRMALLSSVGELFNVDGEYAVPVADSVIRRAVEAALEKDSCETDYRWSRAQAAASGGPRSGGS